MTIRTYIAGFGFSILFTLAAFFAVTQPVPREWLIVVLVALAIAQFMVQVVCFLHLGRDKSHWNFVALAFAMFVVVVLVGGSVWIMYHLEHGQMSHEEIFVEENIFPHTHSD